MSTAHHLILTNRGHPHVHVWKPSCICSWTGVPRRRQREAVAQYRDHAEGMTHRRAVPDPRPVTPATDLPEALR